MITTASSNARISRPFTYVGENLYRHVNGTYYALFKKHGKQYRKNLKTTDLALARRRREDERRKVERLATTDARKMPFAEFEAGQLAGGLAKRWLDTQTHLEPRSRARRHGCIVALAPHFQKPVAKITKADVEAWAKIRVMQTAARTFNMELETLRLVFDFGMDPPAILLENSATAARIKRRKVPKRPPQIPSDDEFVAILKVMRSNKGKPGAKDSADLCEGLTYLGCRVEDSWYLEWRHIDWTNRLVTITGKPTSGTKNHTGRIIPLFKPFARLLNDMLAALPEKPSPTDKVFKVRSCRKAFETARKQLGLPYYRPHHTWRSFFISHCRRAGIDSPTIAYYVGHSDGGVLIDTVYNAFNNEHATRMADKVTFDASKIAPVGEPDPVPHNVIPMPLPTAAASND